VLLKANNFWVQWFKTLTCIAIGAGTFISIHQIIALPSDTGFGRTFVHIDTTIDANITRYAITLVLVQQIATAARQKRTNVELEMNTGRMRLHMAAIVSEVKMASLTSIVYTYHNC
jgi:hypothetical protein